MSFGESSESPVESTQTFQNCDILFSLVSNVLISMECEMHLTHMGTSGKMLDYDLARYKILLVLTVRHPIHVHKQQYKHHEHIALIFLPKAALGSNVLCDLILVT